MQIFRRWILLALLMAAGAWAVDPAVPAKEPDNDIFAPSAQELIIPSGPLAGKSISETRRPIILITPEQRATLGLPDLGSHYLWVANFLSPKMRGAAGQRHFIAAIPLDSIGGATLEIVDRSIYNIPPPKVAEGQAPPPPRKLDWLTKAKILGPHLHAQMEVEFAEDISLYSQKADAGGHLLSTNPLGNMRAMTFAVGAGRPDGDFNVEDGIGESYLKLLLFMNPDEAHRDLIGGREIQRYAMSVTPYQVSEFLKMAANESTRIRLSQFYNAASNGCESVQLDFWDQILIGHILARYDKSWPSSTANILADFRLRGISMTRLASILPNPDHIRAEKGPYNADNPQFSTHVARTAGWCYALLSRGLARGSLLMPPAQ